MSKKRVPAPMKSRRKRMTRLEMVIGNWMLNDARAHGFTGDPADIYEQGIRLADEIRRYIKVDES